MLKYQLDDVCASELETRDSETLPDRAAMSLVNANLAIPVNLALASSYPSCGSLVACGGGRRGAGKASRDRPASARI